MVDTTPFQAAADVPPPARAPNAPLPPPPPSLFAAQRAVLAPAEYIYALAHSRAAQSGYAAARRALAFTATFPAAAQRVFRLGALLAAVVLVAHALALGRSSHPRAALTGLSVPGAAAYTPPPAPPRVGSRVRTRARAPHEETPRPGRLFRGRHALARAARHAQLAVGAGSAARHVVVLAASTHHFARELRNLACGVRAHTGRAPLLLALDDGAADVGVRAGMSVFRPDYGSIGNSGGEARRGDAGAEPPFRFRSDAFNAVSLLKLRAVRDTLRATTADVLFSDADVVLCANAALSLAQRGARGRRDVDVFIQNGRTTELHWPVEPNTGFFYVRNGMRARELFEHLVRAGDDPRNAGLCDQFLFQREVCGLAHDGSIAPGSRGRAVNASAGSELHRCVWRGDDGAKRVVVEQLPLRRFANGDRPLGAPFHAHAPGRLRQACVDGEMTAFHNNYCDARAKTERMNVHGLWLVRSRDDGKCYPMRA